VKKVDKHKKVEAPYAILLAVLLFGTLLTAGCEVSASSVNTVVINEVMADNESTILNDAGNYSDWIELYNTADYAVDISSMFLTENLTSYMWQFPSNTTIQAQGYLLVWADDDIWLGGLHTNFKLSASGQTIGLFAADGSLVDSVTFGKQVQDVSYGRTVDGGSSWNFMIDPTPGKANHIEEGLLTGYPWEIWGIIGAAVAAVCIAVFRGRIFRWRNK
jgi:hypothetical protein